MVPTGQSRGACVLERAPGAEGLAIGPDFVVLDGAGQMMRGLNASGARVWGLIDGRRALGEIAEELARCYGEPVSRVLEDVAAFAGELERKGLVRLRTAELRPDQAPARQPAGVAKRP